MGKVKKAVKSKEQPLIAENVKNPTVNKLKHQKKQLNSSPVSTPKKGRRTVKLVKDLKNVDDIATVKSGSLLRKPNASKIRQADITSALKALLQLLQKKKEEENKLFDDDEIIQLQINVIKVPKTPTRTIRYTLAYSLLNEESEICLITADLKNSDPKNHDKNIEHYEALLKSQGIHNIKTIIPYHQLRTEYEEYEMQKRFVELYDMFLVDGSVSSYVLKKFQGTFLDKHKMPTSIKMSEPNLKEKIDKALLQTQMRIHAKGDSFCVEVGVVNMSVEQITANVMAVHDGLEDNFPGGMDNVRSLHVKTPLSMSIPVYLTLKDQSEVKVPVVKSTKLKASATVRAELTTRANTEVSVKPSGKILVHDMVEEDDASDEEFEGEEQEVKKEHTQNGFEEEEVEENTKEEETYLTNYEQEVEAKGKLKKEKQVKKKAAAKGRKSLAKPANLVEKLIKKSERVKKPTKKFGNEVEAKKETIKKKAVAKKVSKIVVTSPSKEENAAKAAPKKAASKKGEAAKKTIAPKIESTPQPQKAKPNKKAPKRMNGVLEEAVPEAKPKQSKRVKKEAPVVVVEAVAAKKGAKAKVAKGAGVGEAKGAKAVKASKVVLKKAKRMSMKAQ